jgi:hypothetical protein
MKFLPVQFFAATAGEAQSLLDEQRIVVVKAVGGKRVLLRVQVRETGQRVRVGAPIEVIGPQEVILQPVGQQRGLLCAVAETYSFAACLVAIGT